jgi:hypothetical protein
VTTGDSPRRSQHDWTATTTSATPKAAQTTTTLPRVWRRNLINFWIKPLRIRFVLRAFVTRWDKR